MRKIAKNAKEVSAEKLAELKRNAAGILAAARHQMLNYHPFIGEIAMSLDLVPVRDVRVPTACTDGKSIYFDIDFLSDLTKDETSFIIAHEVWHNVMLHFARLGNRVHEVFNYATDLEVNQILVKDGFTAPKDVLTPAKMNVPPDLTAEEYYDILIKKFSQNNGQNGSSGSESNSSQNGPNGSQNGNSGKGNRLSGQFDKHVYEGDKAEDADADSDICDKYGKVGTDSDFTPHPTKEQIERIREAAVSVAQKMERSHGELPAHIAGLIKDLLEPELDWKEQLAKFITRSAGGNKRSWQRPNRRLVHSGIYLPTSDSEKLRVLVGVDTSGSVSDEELRQFLSELTGICNACTSYELTVIQCDANVNAIAHYDEECQFNPFDAIEVCGRGGTDMAEVFNKINDPDFEYSGDVVVMFGDGDIYSVEKEHEPAVPTIWVMTKDAKNVKPPFGEVISFS